LKLFGRRRVEVRPEDIPPHLNFGPPANLSAYDTFIVHDFDESVVLVTDDLSLAALACPVDGRVEGRSVRHPSGSMSCPYWLLKDEVEK
jgi:hypothetical protein